jgi:general secretion pathway protein D
MIKRFLKYFLVISTLSLWVSSSSKAELSFADVSLETLASVISGEIQESIIVEAKTSETFTFSVADPIDKNKILQTFETALQNKGLAIIEQTEHLVIISLDQVQQYLSSGNRLNIGVRQYVYPVQYYAAEDLVEFVSQYFQETNFIQTSPTNNAISFIGSQQDYQRFQNLMEQFDIQPEQDLQRINLIHSDALEMKQVLDELLQSKGWRAGPDNNVSIIAQPSQNQILISGTQTSVNVMKSLIQDLDIPEQLDEELPESKVIGSTEVISLKYANSAELVVILKDLLNFQTNDADDLSITPILSIQANPALNQILLRGEKNLREEAKLIISSMDLPTKQVYVEAIVAEISESAARQLGVQFQGSDSSNDIGISMIADQSNANNLIGSGTALVSSGAGIVFGQGANSITDLGVLINFLKGDGDSQILATPSLMTKNNTSSSILVGQNVPIVTGQYTQNDQASSPFQTISRQDIGIILTIQPNIGSNQLIDLLINQEVSEVDTSSAVTTDVVTTKRSIDTSAVVQSGEVLAIGGLITETSQYNTSKFPILGDIPGLNLLFSQTRESNIRRNLVIFIKPTIVEDSFIKELTKEKLQTLQMDQQFLINQNIGQLPYPPLPDFD